MHHPRMESHPQGMSCSGCITMFKQPVKTLYFTCPSRWSVLCTSIVLLALDARTMRALIITQEKTHLSIANRSSLYRGVFCRPAADCTSLPGDHRLKWSVHFPFDFWFSTSSRIDQFHESAVQHLPANWSLNRPLPNRRSTQNWTSPAFCR